MNKQDLGIYLMIWLISNLIIWLTDMGELTLTEKIVFPIIITVFAALFRVAIFFIIGE